MYSRPLVVDCMIIGFWPRQILSFFLQKEEFIDEIVCGAQCSKWYEISDMEIFQITEENPDPPTNQGAYFNISLSI